MNRHVECNSFEPNSISEAVQSYVGGIIDQLMMRLE
jgi:hypothetical protein